MNTNQQGQIAAFRAVLQAMFDAVVVAPDFDETRLADFIHALNTMGRLLFGYPHLESSESDIFGALDDIAMQLEATKNAIEQTTKEARIVMHDLHEAIGPAEPETEPSERAEVVPDRPITPEPPVGEAPSRVDSAPEEAVAEPPRAIEPPTPNVQDATLFAVIRADPDISMAAAERAVGMAPSRGIQRMKLLDDYGTLPADIKAWREERGKKRGVPKGVHSQTVGKQINQPAAPPPPIMDALPAQTFDERRIASAREESERTWRERHPEEAEP